MGVTFEGGYASPILRKAVFDRLHPGSLVEYAVVSVDIAFPDGHAESEGNPEEAIVCTIIAPDGSWWEGVKEIDLVEIGKDRKPRDVKQTPEQFTADCTKALGRALRDAGIPQKVAELMTLMRWIADLDGRAPSAARRVDRSTGEIGGSTSPDDVDQSDAGGSDEPTLEQQTAVAVSRLSGADKVKLARQARDELGVTNLMRSGAEAANILKLIGGLNAGEDDE